MLCDVQKFIKIIKHFIISQYSQVNGKIKNPLSINLTMSHQPKKNLYFIHYVSPSCL